MERKLSRRSLPDGVGIAGIGARVMMKYAFVGLSGGSGATTLSFAFADYLARKESATKSGGKPGRKYSAARPSLHEKTEESDERSQKHTISVIEINDDENGSCGRDYDKLGIDRRFAGREYVSCYGRLKDGGSVRGIENMDGGVNWLLRVPGEIFGKFDIADYVRLSSGVSTDIVILDIGGSFGSDVVCAPFALPLDPFSDDSEEMVRAADPMAVRTYALGKLLRDCDRVFVVIDPSPSAMMSASAKLDLFKTLWSDGVDVRYVTNKMNSGVDMREMKNFLKIRAVAEIPYFDPASVYSAEYNCCTLYAAPEICRHLDVEFARMNA